MYFFASHFLQSQLAPPPPPLPCAFCPVPNPSPLPSDNGDMGETIPYHKSDVWVDDKKVKQLPREGDMVSFYIVMDEVTKRQKAEQVCRGLRGHQRCCRSHSHNPPPPPRYSLYSRG